MAHTVATPAERPAKSAVRGRTDTPKYSRTSVLCNGQIVWKVGSDRDMDINLNDEEKADLRAVKDVKDDLNALNGLQLYRSRPLTPIEIKQPLRHVHMCLPNNVKARTYTGDLYGSIGHVFSCSDEDFNARRQNIFGVAVQDILYHDFFRRLRRTEYLLWDVEAEKGRWVAVIAHLYSGNSSEEESPNVSGRPPTSPAVDRNRIDEWCIVSAERSPAATARVERVRQRLPKVLREGGFSIDRDSEIDPAIWVPMDPTSWASGLFIFAVIKTLLHRITEFYCKQQTHQRSFWDPIPGWLNIDEVRAEMQGRAAQRCMASTNYRSRIAIEGVRRHIGVKEVVRANELRPRNSDSRPYVTGVNGPDGLCIPITHTTRTTRAVNTSDEGSDTSIQDTTNRPVVITPDEGSDTSSFQDTTTDSESSGSVSPDLSRSKRIRHARRRREVPLLRQAASNLQRQQTESLASSLASSPVEPKGKGKEVAAGPQQPGGKGKGEEVDFTGPLEPPPSDVDGWGDTSDDSDLARHIPLGKMNSVSNESYQSQPGPSSSSIAPGPSATSQAPQQGSFAGPLEPPPSDVEEWMSNASDSGLSQHIPLSKVADPAPKTPVAPPRTRNPPRSWPPASSRPRKQQSLERKAMMANIKELTREVFKGPLDSPPSHAWSDTTDDSDSDRHVPLAKTPAKSSGQAASTAVTGAQPQQPLLATSPAKTPAKTGEKRTAEEAGLTEVDGISSSIAKRLRHVELEKQGYLSEEIDAMDE